MHKRTLMYSEPVIQNLDNLRPEPERSSLTHRTRNGIPTVKPLHLLLAPFMNSTDMSTVCRDYVATCICDYCAATLVYRGFIKLCNGMRYNKISANLELPWGASQDTGPGCLSWSSSNTCCRPFLGTTTLAPQSTTPSSSDNSAFLDANVLRGSSTSSSGHPLAVYW